MDNPSDTPTVRRPGRPPRLSESDRATLLELIQQNPTFGGDNLSILLAERTGHPCSDTTVRVALVAMGWRRMPRPPAPPPDPMVPETKDLPRYQDHHRVEPSWETPKSYPSDLTDEEWALLEPHLRGRRQRTPCGEETRATVNALLYIARTGCQWRFLPHDFPKWQTVAKAYYRWVERGVWEKVNDELRRLVRVGAGRKPEPTAAIIDSQSVKTTEKGGSAATTRGKRSTVGSDTSS